MSRDVGKTAVREREGKCIFCLSSKVCLKMFLIDHGCANHATEGETLKSPIHYCDVTYPLLVHWRTVYFVLAL